MTSTQEDLYAGHWGDANRKDRCSSYHPYIILLGTASGVGSSASQIWAVFIREAMTNDNRTSFCPSKSYLLQQSYRLACGDLSPRRYSLGA